MVTNITLGRWINRIAWLNVLIHVPALALAVLGMRPGTPMAPLADRLTYLAESPAGWWLGWAAWMCCVPTLIAFFSLAAMRLGEHANLAWLAVVVAVVGGGIDLSCDVIFIVMFPQLAAQAPESVLIFLTVERATSAVSLIVANGLYTTAALLLTICLHGRREFGPITTGVGYAIAVFGYLLALAGFTGVPWHVEWATGPTIGFFCLWTLLVAHCFRTSKDPA